MESSNTDIWTGKKEISMNPDMSLSNFWDKDI